MEKKITKEEMEMSLLANGWHQNPFDNNLWGNHWESGFLNTRDAFNRIECIANIKHESNKGWKFIPEKY